MLFAIARHYPDLPDENERIAGARQAAEWLHRGALEMGLSAASSLVLTSPEKRARTTAAVFGKVLTATVERNPVFGNVLGSERLNSSEEMRKVWDATEVVQERIKDHRLVVVITHQPMVRPLFGDVFKSHKERNNGPEIPNFWFGVHLVNLDTAQYLCSGTFGS